MQESTEYLKNKIRRMDDPADIMRDPGFNGPAIHDFLRAILKKNDLSSAELARIMLLDRSYVYQLLNGTRKPTRKQLLQIALIMGLNEVQTQQLLNIGGRTQLYPRNRYDALILYAIGRKMTLEQTRELLVRAGESPLGEEPPNRR